MVLVQNQWSSALRHGWNAETTTKLSLVFTDGYSTSLVYISPDLLSTYFIILYFYIIWWKYSVCCVNCAFCCCDTNQNFNLHLCCVASLHCCESVPSGPLQLSAVTQMRSRLSKSLSSLSYLRAFFCCNAAEPSVVMETHGKAYAKHLTAQELYLRMKSSVVKWWYSINLPFCYKGRWWERSKLSTSPVCLSAPMIFSMQWLTATFKHGLLSWPFCCDAFLN